MAQTDGSVERTCAAGFLDVAAAGRRWGHSAREAGWGLRSRVRALGDGAPWIPHSAHAMAQLRVLRANGHWQSLWD